MPDFIHEQTHTGNNSTDSAPRKKKNNNNSRKADTFGAGEKTGKRTATDLKLRRKKQKKRLDEIMRAMGMGK